MTNDDSETVWVAGNNTSTRKYHTNRDCSLGPDTPRERDRAIVEAWGWRECHRCADTYDEHGAGNGRALNQALKNTDPSDL